MRRYGNHPETRHAKKAKPATFEEGFVSMLELASRIPDSGELASRIPTFGEDSPFFEERDDSQTHSQLN